MKLLALVLSLAFTLAACGTAVSVGGDETATPPTPTATRTPEPEPTGPPTTLEEARAAWAEAGISDYRYRLAYLCFCPTELTEPREIAVVGGEVSEVTPPPAGPEFTYGTIDDLHDLIASEQMSSDAVEVTYDERGVPVAGVFDRLEEAIDDELQFDATWLGAGPGATLGARWAHAHGALRDKSGPRPLS